MGKTSMRSASCLANLVPWYRLTQMVALTPPTWLTCSTTTKLWSNCVTWPNHPEAKHTAEGIVRWWLLQQKFEEENKWSLFFVLTMFVGRTGPLTLATWGRKNGTARVKYPEAKVLIG